MFSPTALAGRSAIITGASRGIGLAIAQAFAAAGARKLLLTSRNAEALEGAKRTVQKGIGGGDLELSCRAGDVGDRAFWTGLVSKEEGHDADILVNAAGIAHASLLTNTDAATVEAVYRTNLLGVTWGCQVVGRAMMRRAAQQGRGRGPGRRRGKVEEEEEKGEEEGARGRKLGGGCCIINVASLLGVRGGRGSAAYAASKAGVIGLTRALSAELGRADIRVNALVPGYVDTEMTRATLSSSGPPSSLIESIPTGRFGTPEEIADAAVFLAAHGYANNCVLNLDGGLSAT